MKSKEEVESQIKEIEQNLHGLTAELDSLIKNEDYEALLDGLSDVQNVVSMLVALKAVVYED